MKLKQEKLRSTTILKIYQDSAFIRSLFIPKYENREEMIIGNRVFSETEGMPTTSTNYTQFIDIFAGK